MTTNATIPHPDLTTTPEDWGRIEAFLRTHVGRYVLPKKLAAAQAKNAVNVSIPTADAVRLLARIGEHVTPLPAPATEEDNALPATLAALPGDLTEMLDWEPDGEAILTREQVEALILIGVRKGFEAAAPRA